MATVRSQHRFTVKEGAEGEPFIMLELAGGAEIPALRSGFLSFDLRDGTTIERAREIAEMLNRAVTTTALTTP